jgi:hypothetical protein
VVGGGIFGVTAAVALAEAGHFVELFERADDLLTCATGINQYRLHRGYHYPRSPETIAASRASEASFREAYGEAVVDEHSHYYAIARHGSKTSAADYLACCRRHDIEVVEQYPSVLRRDAVELCVLVREGIIDVALLRALCWRNIRRAGIRVHLGSVATKSTLSEFDTVVLATYAALNELADPPRRYQFEVCEKPVVRLPAAYAGVSAVVMDGPFMCFDPVGRSDRFVLGNVIHAIHHQNVGYRPEVPPSLQPLLNSGVVSPPPFSRFESFVEAAQEFFVGFDQAEHVGSMFTVRTVLPNTDLTDERPTLVTSLDDRVMTIFSGKIGTCVAAASQVVQRLRDEQPVTAG